MDNKAPAADLPDDAQVVREWFDEWRQMRCGQGKISDELWSVAVEMAVKYGVHPAAKMLRVDYKCLKRRVEEAALAAGISRTQEAPLAFIELRPTPAPFGGGQAEAVLDIDQLACCMAEERS